MGTYQSMMRLFVDNKSCVEHTVGLKTNSFIQDIWIVVNYEKNNSRRIRREAKQQFLPDNDRTCGLRRVEVDLDDWYPNLKDVVLSPKTFTFTFCEGTFHTTFRFIDKFSF